MTELQTIDNLSGEKTSLVEEKKIFQAKYLKAVYDEDEEKIEFYDDQLSILEISIIELTLKIEAIQDRKQTTR